MRLDLVKRRLETLDYFFAGGLSDEAVHSLSTKYSVAPQTIWNDWSRRKDWLPRLFSLRDSDLKVHELAARLEKTLTSAYRTMVMTGNENTRIGAQRTVAMISEKLSTLYETHGITPSIYTELLERLLILEDATKNDQLTWPGGDAKRINWRILRKK